MAKKKKKFLNGYTKKGKHLIPYFLAHAPSKLELVNWNKEILPNTLLIALLFDSYDYKKAIEVVRKFTKLIIEIIKSEKPNSFALISDYYSLTNEDWSLIRKELKNSEIYYDLCTSIYPLISLYTECPLGNLFDNNMKELFSQDLDTCISTIKRVIHDCYPKGSKEAVMVQTTVIYLEIINGELIITKNSNFFKDPNKILDYPNSDESKALAASARAAILAMYQPKEKCMVKWSSYFWRHNYQISACDFIQLEDTGSNLQLNKQHFKNYFQHANIFKTELYININHVWNNIKIDLFNAEKDEIMAGLISRQAHLVTEIAENPKIWVADIGNILFRCLIDTYILIKWMLNCGKEDDFKKYVEYGLGKEKLHLEHLIKKEEEREDNDLSREIERKKKNLESQINPDFITINVGAAFNKNTREMAIEADCKDDYDLAYAPLSAITHCSWNVLTNLYLVHCLNPLHRYHLVPSFGEFPLSFEIVLNAVSVMEKSFREWEQANVNTKIENSACQKFISNIFNLLGSVEE